MNKLRLLPAEVRESLVVPARHTYKRYRIAFGALGAYCSLFLGVGIAMHEIDAHDSSLDATAKAHSVHEDDRLARGCAIALGIDLLGLATFVAAEDATKRRNAATYIANLEPLSQELEHIK